MYCPDIRKGGEKQRRFILLLKDKIVKFNDGIYTFFAYSRAPKERGRGDGKCLLIRIEHAKVHNCSLSGERVCKLLIFPR